MLQKLKNKPQDVVCSINNNTGGVAIKTAVRLGRKTCRATPIAHLEKIILKLITPVPEECTSGWYRANSRNLPRYTQTETSNYPKERENKNVLRTF